MNAGKLRKVLLPALSFSLAVMLTAVNADAAESVGSESAVQVQTAAAEKEVPDAGEVTAAAGEDILNDGDVIADKEGQAIPNTAIIPDLSNEDAADEAAEPTARTGQNKLWISVPHISGGQRLQVSKGSDLDHYGIEVGVVNADSKFEAGPVKLTNDMVSGFDTMSVGEQDVTVTFEGVSSILPIEVIEGQASGEAVSIELKESHIAIPVGGYASAGADLIDAQGRTICNITVTPDMIPGLDNTTVGTRQYTVTYEGFTAELTVEVANMRFEASPQTIPIGGKLNIWEYVQIVDAADPSKVFDEMPIIHAHNNEDPAWYDKIDTGKPGVQQVTFQHKYGGNGVTLTGTIQVTVGTPPQMTVDKLPPEAQAAMPDGTYVGSWDVPSGEVGAGTWTFQTDLTAGTEVVVWSFHNNEWLKIGIYKVDANGIVTAAFTADQLSPILITKNSENSGNDINGGTGSNNNTGSDSSTNANNSNTNVNNSTGSNSNANANNSTGSNSAGKTVSPKTGDPANAPILYLTAFLSLAIISVVVYFKRKRIAA